MERIKFLKLLNDDVSPFETVYEIIQNIRNFIIQRGDRHGFEFDSRRAWQKDSE